MCEREFYNKVNMRAPINNNIYTPTLASRTVEDTRSDVLVDQQHQKTAVDTATKNIQKNIVEVKTKPSEDLRRHPRRHVRSPRSLVLDSRSVCWISDPSI